MRSKISGFVALFIFAVSIPSSAFAAECQNAVISSVMASGSNCGPGAVAFRTSTYSVWQCVAKSGTGYSADQIEAFNQVVIAAFLSGKTVEYDISGTSACNASNYSTSLDFIYPTFP
jgi:hypothetical protein